MSFFITCFSRNATSVDMSNVNRPHRAPVVVCRHHFMCIAVNTLSAFRSLVVFPLFVDSTEQQRNLERSSWPGFLLCQPDCAVFIILLERERATQCYFFFRQGSSQPGGGLQSSPVFPPVSLPSPNTFRINLTCISLCQGTAVNLHGFSLLFWSYDSSLTCHC